MADWTVDYFGKELLTKDGAKPTQEALAGKKYIAIYFSAHWCPPCRGFTPTLGEFYEQLEEEDPNALAIVFASSDSDNKSFEEYYGSMPFFAVPFSASDKIQALGSKFSVRGIPALIVLEAAEGKVKDADGRSTVSACRGITQKATTKWAEAK